MSDWSARTIVVDLSFLDDTMYTLTAVSDGVNAEKYPADYKFETSLISGKDKLKISLAPGGGYVGKIVPKP